MKHSIVIVIVSLTACILTASAQQQPTTWTSNPYYFYSNINTPLAMGPQIMSADGMAGMNQKVFSGHDDYSIANTLGSHVVILSTCLRELKTTKSDLVHTTQRLDQTHTVVESVKKELDSVKTTVENMKKEMSASAASSIGRMPHSCDDLHKIGHRKSGLFSVMGNKTVDSVYCDFTKPTNDAGFQKMIGYFNVKTSPVYFHAQKTQSLSTADAVVPFELLRLNLGGGMSTSGIFTAPKSGKYFFTYSGIGDANIHVRVEMQVKTEKVDWTRVGQAFGHVTHQSFSLHATLELAKDNQIRLKLIDGKIHDADTTHYTNYVGQLLEEDIVQ